MKDIRIKDITISNFKGVTSKRVFKFNGKDAKVYGDNGTGKTTIADAFAWALFGKDSDGKTDFDIKPNTLERPEVLVTLTLIVDGRDVELTRVLEESWAVSRVDGEEKFTGNKTSFLINGMPKSAGEYKAYVDSIASEELFRRLTDARVFLSMKKQDMRKALIEMVGGISDEDIIAEDERFAEVIQELTLKECSPEDLLKLTKQNITTAEAEQKSKLTRIDEIRNMMPEEQDWDKVEEGLKKGEEYLQEIDGKLAQAKDASAVHSKISALKDRMATYKSDTVRKANTDRAEALATAERTKGTIEALKIRLSAQIASSADASVSMDSIRTQMSEMKAEHAELVARRKVLEDNVFVPFEDGVVVCDKCGQDLPASKLEELNTEAEIRFNKQKTNDIASIDKQIKSLLDRANILKVSHAKAQANACIANEDVEKIRADIEREESKLIITNNRLESLPEVNGDSIDLSEDAPYTEMQHELNALTESVNGNDTVSTEQLLEDKSKVLQQISALRTTLERKADKEKTTARIQELIDEGKELVRTAALERKKRVLVEHFLRKRAELLEVTINGQFKTISFRLFEELVNGELKDDCTPLLQNVEYMSASHSEQIRGNMEIVSSMQKAHGIHCPVFLDNSEACTWFPEMDNQTIQLHVSAQDKTLRVELEGE